MGLRGSSSHAAGVGVGAYLPTYQWPTADRRPLVSGLWSLVSGLWSLVSGLWSLVNRWPMANASAKFDRLGNGRLVANVARICSDMPQIPKR
jgi:hypothetical protein